MPLVVQTFPQTPGANAYGDVVGFKAYHDLRLNDYSAYADPQITAALIEATTYLDIRFGYNGWKTDKDQSTEFPRNELYNMRGDLVTGVPTQVVNATYEYAIRWLRNGSSLMGDPTRDETGQNLKVHEVEAGPVRERKEYSAFSTYALPDYPYPDGLLKAQGFVANPSNHGISSSPTGRA